MITNNTCIIEIHGFSDSSITAYVACLYILVIDSNNKRTSNLICAKSKVAPLKTMSLPRLELCAAQVLARLAKQIIPKLNLNIKKKYFWTDSINTWHWITSPSTKWQTFVAHRVGEIQDLTNI